MNSLSTTRTFGLLTVASSLFFAATTTAEQTVSAHLCGDAQAWASSNGEYIFNNNAWNNDGSGASCTDVFNDGAGFETTWSWTKDGNNTHAFPNVGLNTPLFPLLVSNLSAMNLEASWTMSPVDSATRANVVWDMFIDPDTKLSSSATEAKYEIMIWIGQFDDPFPLGASVNPFGVVNKTLPSITIGTTVFTLFSGDNSVGQTVHSWLSTAANVASFDGDVKPLIDYLTKNNLVESDAYMGILQFGSETWHSTANVTFAVTSFDLNVTSTDTAANAEASAAINPNSTTTSGTSGSKTSSPLSSTATPTGGSGSGTSSGSSIVSLPFWFGQIAAAGCVFAML